MHATDSSQSPHPRSVAWIWLVLAVAAAGLFMWLSIFGPFERAGIGTVGRAIGRRLPYFRLDPLLNGAKPVAKDDLLDKVSVVNFWGTWCGPCIEEFPHYVKLSEEFSSHEDFRLFLVSCGQGIDTDPRQLQIETEQFLASRGVMLPIYCDINAGLRRSMVEALDLDRMGYPTTLVFDRTGLIRGFWVGYTPGDERSLRALVKKLLDEKSS